LHALAVTLLLVSEAKAGFVDVGYTITTSFGIPGLGVPTIGPPGAGTAVIRYTSALSGPYSAVGGFGAFSPLHATAKVMGATFIQPISFALFGDLITAPTPIVGGFGGGPGLNLLLSPGTLGVGILGGASGLVHCTGATCGGLIPFPPSVLTPFGFALSGTLLGVAATPGSSLLPSLAARSARSSASP
jgi:hypothetical protein